MDFAPVSGNPALDLAGTLRSRRTEPEELLVDPSALRSWLVASGVAAESVRVGPAALASALELRAAIYRLACDRLAGREFDRDALRVLNETAAGPVTRIALTPDGMVRRGDAGTALADVARSLIVLLADPDAPVRECGHPSCTRIYVDRSRGARRTWCGMAECGNRVKAAAYRARRRGSAPRE